MKDIVIGTVLNNSGAVPRRMVVKQNNQYVILCFEKQGTSGSWHEADDSCYLYENDLPQIISLLQKSIKIKVMT